MKYVQEFVLAMTYQGRYKDLKALDLQHQYLVLTDRTLSHVCSALPLLQHLALPLYHNVSQAGLAAAVALLPNVTSLHISYIQLEYRPPFLQPRIYAMIMNLPLLQELTLPHLVLGAPFTAVPPHLTRLRLVKSDFCCVDTVTLSELAALVAHLPALEALEVVVKTSDPSWKVELSAVEARSQLQPLSRLNALTLSHLAPADVPTAQLLYQIGSLTNLRSLNLHLKHTGVTPMERGWLAHLALLTSVSICFAVPTPQEFDEVDDYNAQHAAEQDPWGLRVHRGNWPAEEHAPAGAAAQPPCRRLGAFDKVALAVPHMAALRELRISGDSGKKTDWKRERFAPGAYSQVAAAASSLQLLHLECCTFFADAIATVSLLTGLTSLKLADCRHPSAECGYGGLSALTGLRALEFHAEAMLEVLPCEVVAGLSTLEALVLRDGHFGGAYLSQACSSLLRLTALDVSFQCSNEWVLLNNDGGTAADSAVGSRVTASLEHLSQLEVLDMTGAVEDAALGQLQAPASLRRLNGGAYVRAAAVSPQ